jgi:hypothetical protein
MVQHNAWVASKKHLSLLWQIPLVSFMMVPAFEARKNF